MDPHLHELFARAVDTEPLGPPEDLARAAMAQGTRLRRRRLLTVGGVPMVAVAGFAAAVGLAVTPSAGGQAPQAPAPASAGCSSSIPYAGSVVYLLLRTDITEQQRIDLADTLPTDALVQTFEHDTTEQAFERFKKLWRDEPVPVTEPTESFRIRLSRPGQFEEFAARYRDRPGVSDVVGAACLGDAE